MRLMPKLPCWNIRTRDGRVGVDRVRRLPEASPCHGTRRRSARAAGARRRPWPARLSCAPVSCATASPPRCCRSRSATKARRLSASSSTAGLVQRPCSWWMRWRRSWVEQHGPVDRQADEARGQVRRDRGRRPRLRKPERSRARPLCGTRGGEQGHGPVQRRRARGGAGHTGSSRHRRSAASTTRACAWGRRGWSSARGGPRRRREPGVAMPGSAGHRPRKNRTRPAGVRRCSIVPHGYVYGRARAVDTKIAVVLRDDLEVWQRLNVTAFLVSGIGWRAPEVDRRAVRGRGRDRVPADVPAAGPGVRGSKEDADRVTFACRQPRSRAVGFHRGPLRDGQRPG